MGRLLVPSITFSALGLFWLSTAQLGNGGAQQPDRPSAIAVAAPIQVLLYGGDRFLAADIDAIRAVASVTEKNNEDYLLRTHETVSRLNPCHEDNYWIGNASLSWGGAEEQGLDLLRNATHCRYWDEWPVFFYGFNQHFFFQNTEKARHALEIAAQRSTSNAAAFRNFSIMLAAGDIDDTRMALKMLKHEHDEAEDPDLKAMLAKRVVRLEGLLLLRDALTQYENRFHRKLNHPQELLDSGILRTYPEDPLGIGYEYRDHGFHLRQMQIR